MIRKVCILDYGIGNVKSIYNALIEIGADPFLSSDQTIIMSADAVILPGVGAFAKGMENLIAFDLIHVIHDFIQTGKPFLGICLGMQMLMEESEEFEISKGLGLIKGKVVKMPIHQESPLKLPHVSWNELREPEVGRWNGSLLENTAVSADVYFVHSYVAVPENKGELLAVANYDENDFCAAVKKDNITGVQFHPEKSSKIGLSMLLQFLRT